MYRKLTQTQLGIYAACAGASDEGNYNIPFLYELPEAIEVERLAAALEAVVEAHPYIKLRLETTESGEVMARDCSSEPWHTPITEVADIAEVEPSFGDNFSLPERPLFRIEIFKTKKSNYLLVDFHHIIFDGMSKLAFNRDLAAAYSGRALQREAVSGFEIADREAALRSSALLEQEREAVVKEFGAAEDISSLPQADRYGDERERWAIKAYELDVADEAIEGLCERVGVRPSLMLLTAMGFTLARTNGDEQAVYSTVWHGRADKELRSSFTMMVKTLPVYLDLRAHTTVEELLTAAQRQERLCRSLRAYSFADFNADFNFTSEVCLGYQGEFHDFAIELAGLKIEAKDLRRHTLGITFNVQVLRRGGRYVAEVEYPANRYSEGYIEQFCRSYNNVVREFTEKSELAKVSLCGEEDLRLLDSFNRSSAIDYEDDTTVVDLLRRAAARYPDREAAVFKDKHYSYRELDLITDRLAGYIAERIGSRAEAKEPVVSVLIPRCEYMFIVSVAALKAGCAYEPLDPDYPQERLNFMVSDAGAALLVADDGLRPLVDEYRGEVLLTSELEAIMADESLKAPECRLTPSSLFILLYTSGTTGTPKGVMLEHRNIVAFCRWYARYYSLGPGHNVAAYASFGFDANMMDTYPTLTLGATLHIIPQEIRLDLIALNRYFEEHHITHSLMTTQVGVQFLLNADNHSLQHLTVGGEKLVSVDPPQGYALHNAYGPTECTVLSTIKRVERREENIPIGRAIDTMACFVMDRHGNRLPVGAVGELVISGAQVGRGYLGREDKTAEAFFSINGHRAYHSGDMVRYRPDGDVEFVGRKDGQIKIRGFRIELKEVEAVIREFEGVNDVSVQAFEEPGGGGKYIAAYVVADGELDVDALNRFIMERKPPYMVPATTMQIEKIPLNVNQKVDKKALPKPQFGGAKRDGGSAAQAPLNRLERELKEIVSEVINSTDFSLTDILGYMGLTSIAAIRLATLIYKRYGVQVDSKGLTSGTMQDIENQILDSLLHKAAGEESEQRDEAAGPADDQALTLTYPQQGVYFDCVKNPESVMYNVPFMYTFPATVEEEQLVEAVKATVGNHQSFRLTFGTKGGEPVMQVGTEVAVDVPIKHMSGEELKREMERFVRPFNLQRGPLFRLEVVRSEEGLHLLIDCHHLITDGGSFDLVMREISARLRGEAVEAERYPYTLFALHQKQAEHGEEYEKAKEFFHSRLKECEGASEITADMPKDEHAVSLLGKCSYKVERAPIERLAKELGVTPASLYLAAVFYTVSRYVGNKHVYLGTISNGRSDLRVHNTTGMFVNTLALASEIGEQSVSEYILATAAGFTDTLRHEQYPFARISADYGFRPEIVFEYQVGVMADYEVGGVKLKQHPLQLDLAKFKLKVAVNDAAEEGLHEIEVGYDRSLYSERLAAELAESVGAVLSHFVEAPQQALKRVSIMSERQREQVEQFYTSARADVPYTRFYEAIEHYAAEDPERVALIACDATLTYRELNAEANRVARALMARGVKRGDRVVLLLPRRSDVMCCIYGVSKAGAAYIPCDPDYPADRISLITADSGARYIITTAEHMAEFGSKAIDVSELRGADVPLTNPEVEVDGDDLVYLIYTSGSTGRPKGVMLRHRAICNYLYPHPANIHIHSLIADNVKAYLSITTLSFDMSLKEYGAALHNGVTLVLASEQEVNNPMLLAALMERTGAEVINGTPSRLVSYMELPAFRQALSRCKSVWSGGEKYSDKLLKSLQAMGLRIFNTYGPTEITVSSNGSELTHRPSVAVGRPLLNVREFIVDSDGNELPQGVVGELYIGGMGVAVGYNNLEEQTAERFITYKPQRGEPERVYKSGDYARWLADGEVDILGRTDHQVKLRGLRIELGEVESAISKVAGMTQVVVAIRTLGGKEHLSAWFTAERPIDIEQLKAEISRTLTHYMVPTAYLQLEHFPLTPNGKTDLKHLPEPLIAQSSGEYVAPRGKVESDMCEIFREVLEVERVGATDSFFELGGTSLSVTRVIIKANGMGYDVAYAELFNHPTPRSLAALIEGSDKSSASSEEYSDEEVSNYDYSAINEVLRANTLENFMAGERLELGNVLLTGASGYLGIHVLHELLADKDSERQIYCLVRHGREGLSSEERLKNLLFYYFEDNYDELFGRRLHVIDGDVTNEHVFDSVGHVDTVINCAAVVKHFSEGTEIEDINIGGLQNCVNFCLRTGAHLVQTGTFSISGQSVNGVPEPSTLFSEQMLYFGQLLSSKYTHSKFLAERILLEAVATKGLVGKIVRLGNLAPRATDGEFQINFGTNSAMGRLHVFQLLGACSYSLALSQMEFSPIDEVARAILLLATTPKQCVVFHPFNNHMQLLGDVVREMAHTLGCSIEEVEEDEFQRRVQEAGADEQKARILQSMLAYESSGKDKITGFAKHNPYTCAVLARLGFHWNTTSWDYVNRFIRAIASLDFFEARR